MSVERFYQGKGIQSKEPQVFPKISVEQLKTPKGYRAGQGLVAAVDVALRLGMPLLLTGEPGIGKSSLAYSLAWEMGLGEPLRYVIKSDTQSKDLFYHFDTLGRFRAAKDQGEIDPRWYIQFKALGQAILYTYPREEIKRLLGPAIDEATHPAEPCRSVVLIDEIDKAPRDVPNDLLSEIEDLCFDIPELAGSDGHEDKKFSSKRCNRFYLSATRSDFRPIIIMTSNSEKALPDAFLRRCVYYHMPFPEFSDQTLDRFDETLDEGITVQGIVASRLYARYRQGGEMIVQDATDFFRFLRDQYLERKPGLSEFLNWLDYLLPTGGMGGLNLGRLVDQPLDQLISTMRVTLLKNKNDQAKAKTLWAQWKG